MKVHIEGALDPINNEPVVGNVYPHRGGRGGGKGWMHVIIAITKPKCKYDLSGPKVLMMTVDKDGDPQAVTSYGLHYVQDLTPIAFVEGLDELQLNMRPL